MNLILASASPRRKEILSLLNLPFQVIPALIEERVETPEEAVSAAADKARWVAERNPGAYILGADTVVVNQGRVLGKPKSLDEAKTMLLSLSDKIHEVVTGVCLVGPGFQGSGLVRTEIRVNPLSEAEVLSYLKDEHVLDAAGAYKIQGCFSKFVPEIRGDYYNVVGLPLFWVYENLKAAQILK